MRICESRRSRRIAALTARPTRSAAPRGISGAKRDGEHGCKEASDHERDGDGGAA